MTPGRAGRACAALATLGLALSGCGADVEPAATQARTAPPAATTLSPAPEPQEAPAAPGLRGSLGFHLKRRAQLRLHPHGKVVRSIGTTTEFGSPRIFAVAARKPGWVLVRTSVRGHHVAWLPTRSGVLFSEPRTLVVDLSKRTLSVFHRGRRTDVYRVAIGAKGTPTPRGRFAVTDRLRLKPGGPYGCCVLALTARQPHIAQGWGGGDRVAIHGTPNTWTIGRAISHGCLRASNDALRQLMRRIRLGTPVTIHG